MDANVNIANTREYGVFRPGGTKDHLKAWLELTHDPFVIKCIQGVEVDLEEEPTQRETPTEFQMSVENKQNITVVVAEHLSKGIVEKCTPCRGQFLSNIFLRPKPNGKHRLILDLSDLNDSVTYRHFKMESLQTAIDMLQHNCFMASLDLSDAYYSVPVVEEDRKLLRFIWGGGAIPVHVPSKWSVSSTQNIHQNTKTGVCHLARTGTLLFRVHRRHVHYGRNIPTV